MSLKKRVLVQLDAASERRLEGLAAESRISKSAFAGLLITQSLERLSATSGSLDERTSAETKLLSWVADYVAELKKRGSWDAHVTRTVFEAIKNDAGDLHACATADPESRFRVNSVIGALVRRGLGAELLMKNGRRLKANTSPRDQPLIKSYTLLQPADKES